MNFCNNLQLNEVISNKKSDKPEEMYGLIKKKLVPMIEWIPYSRIINLKEIAEGGFGIIYQATMKQSNNSDVIVKRFKLSQKISKYFLNEVYIYFFIILFFYFYYSKIILFKFYS